MLGNFVFIALILNNNVSIFSYVLAEIVVLIELPSLKFLIDVHIMCPVC